MKTPTTCKEYTGDYDNEPVYYCSNCYSLKIKREECTGIDYCAECGCSDILETPISIWEQLYESRYGKRYTAKNENPRKSFIFKLPVDSLKAKVYESPHLNAIVHSLYAKFPKGLTRIECVVLLFDKLIKDNRLDDLRMELLKYLKV